jgi:hypothetical protein
LITDLADRKGLKCLVDDDSLIVFSKTLDSDLAEAEHGLIRCASAVRALDVRSWTDADREELERIGVECSKIVQAYSIKFGGKAPNPETACGLLDSVLAAAMSNKCWVYDLHSTKPDAPDFKSSLLRCLINGVGRPNQDDKPSLVYIYIYIYIYNVSQCIWR